MQVSQTRADAGAGNRGSGALPTADTTGQSRKRMMRGGLWNETCGWTVDQS
jgi:hypothetical protein